MWSIVLALISGGSTIIVFPLVANYNDFELTTASRRDVCARTETHTWHGVQPS